MYHGHSILKTLKYVKHFTKTEVHNLIGIDASNTLSSMFQAEILPNKIGFRSHENEELQIIQPHESSVFGQKIN